MDKNEVKKIVADLTGPDHPKTKTDAGIESWIADVKRRYAAGTLPQWKIKRIEAIPGWKW
jgi:hypothetical protein